MKTVLLVDDDNTVLLGTGVRLKSMGYIIYTAKDAVSAISAVRKCAPDVVVLDISLPAGDGFLVADRLQTLVGSVATPIIFMTGQGDIQSAVVAMKAGAFDFLEKPYEEEVLLAAIEAALAASPDDHIHQTMDSAQRIARLSPREREVLDGLVAGASNKVIAFDLGLSVRTVEVHRARMMERLGTRQLAEAIRLAVLATLAPAPRPPSAD